MSTESYFEHSVLVCEFDLLHWRGKLRVVAAALYDMDYPDLGDECWQLAAEIEATANPVFEEE